VTAEVDGFGRRSAALLAVLGYAALLLTWVVGNPPFAGPDESGHYSRAVSIPMDGFVGDQVDDYGPPDLNPVQLAVVRQAVRQVTIPAGLSPRGRSCFIHSPRDSVACLDEAEPPPDEPVEWITNVGTYQPAFYILPGYVATLASTPEVAAGLARGAGAATSLALLASGIFVVRQPGRGRLWVLGPLVAITPMVLFTAASLNPSGPEIAAGFALTAALLRLSRASGPSWGVWGLAGVAGAALVLGRSIGPVWLVVHLIAFVLWHGLSPTVRLVRSHPAEAATAALAVAIALAANFAFEAAHGLEVTIDPRPVGPSLAAAWSFTREALVRHAVGVFGYLNVPLPRVLYQAWWLLGLSLWGLALALGSARQRAVLGLVTAGVLAAPILLETLVLRHHGFHIQGRHLLPILVIVPLMSGEIVADRSDRVAARVATGLVVSAGALVACVHLLAWYTNARRAAAGITGTWGFPLRAEWAPPGGWLPWLALAALGAALLAAAALSAASGSRRHPARPPGSSSTDHPGRRLPPRSRPRSTAVPDERT